MDYNAINVIISVFNSFEVILATYAKKHILIQIVHKKCIISNSKYKVKRYAYIIYKNDSPAKEIKMHHE